MANINSSWKRFVAVGCSHGHLSDPEALRTVLKFVKDYKPHRRIHLGDFTDQAAFRGGAQGTRDEAVNIEVDLLAGLRFLQDFETTDLLLGNHEIRLYQKMDHHNAILSQAATSVVNEIRSVAKKLKLQNFIEHYDIRRSWIEIGDYKLLHGFMYSEQALRDHAEHFGNTIMAHKHVAGMAAGRRSDSPHCFCVGTLANIANMDYASGRRSTATWSKGLVYGETNGKETHPWLSHGSANQMGGWHLPR